MLLIGTFTAAKMSYVCPQQWDVRGNLKEDSGVAEGGTFEYCFIYSTVTLYSVKIVLNFLTLKSTKAHQSQSSRGSGYLPRGLLVYFLKNNFVWSVGS